MSQIIIANEDQRSHGSESKEKLRRREIPERALSFRIFLETKCDDSANCPKASPLIVIELSSFKRGVTTLGSPTASGRRCEEAQRKMERKAIRNYSEQQ